MAQIETSGQSVFHRKVSWSAPEYPVKSVRRDVDGIPVDPNYSPHVVEQHFVDHTRLPLGYVKDRYNTAARSVRSDEDD